MAGESTSTVGICMIVTNLPFGVWMILGATNLYFIIWNTFGAVSLTYSGSQSCCVVYDIGIGSSAFCCYVDDNSSDSRFNSRTQTSCSYCLNVKKLKSFFVYHSASILRKMSAMTGPFDSSISAKSIPSTSCGKTTHSLVLCMK